MQVGDGERVETAFEFFRNRDVPTKMSYTDWVVLAGLRQLVPGGDKHVSGLSLYASYRKFRKNRTTVLRRCKFVSRLRIRARSPTIKTTLLGQMDISRRTLNYRSSDILFTG